MPANKIKKETKNYRIDLDLVGSQLEDSILGCYLCKHIGSLPAQEYQGEGGITGKIFSRWRTRIMCTLW